MSVEYVKHRYALPGSPIKDSGKRRQFESGAVRDDDAGKPRLSLLPPKALARWAMHMTQGAAKYDDHNWSKGMPTSVILDSLGRHFLALLRGDTDEDHAAALMCNIAFFIQFEGTEWDDRHEWTVPPRPKTQGEKLKDVLELSDAIRMHTDDDGRRAWNDEHDDEERRRAWKEKLASVQFGSVPGTGNSPRPRSVPDVAGRDVG